MAKKGTHLTEEQKQHLREIRLGKTMSEETKRKIKDSTKGKNKGKKHTPESIEKMKFALKGRVPWNKGLVGVQIPTPETRLKMSNSHIGIVNTQDARDKISISLMGKPKSNTHRQNISKAKMGHPGFPHTEETKELLRSQRIGVPKSKEHVEKMSISIKRKYETDLEYREKMRRINIGRYPSQETRKKLSECRRGEKSYLYKGGISYEPYPPEFSRQVRKETRVAWGHMCADCFKTRAQIGQQLDVHHIDYDKDNNHPLNLIALCRPCHSISSNATLEDREKHRERYQQLVNGRLLIG